MGDRVKNLLIGIFVITGICILVFTILFLKPTVGDGKEILYVRFTNINKIGIGTYVTYAGRPVGEVVAIQEISHLRDQPTDTLGRFYVYQLILKIDSGIKVYDTDKISLQTSGLLGEKSVAITPTKPVKGVTPKLITNQPIYADSIDPIENTFYELSQLADEVQATVQELRIWIDQNKESLSYAVEWFGETMHQASISLKTLNEGDMIPHLNQATRSLASVMCQIDEGLYQLHQENSFQNAGLAISHLKEASQSIENITRSIDEGKGSLGKIFKKDDLYLSLMNIMNKVNTLMNDINHYGLLFSNNKQWQRLHTQQNEPIIDSN